MPHFEASPMRSSRSKVTEVRVPAVSWRRGLLSLGGEEQLIRNISTSIGDENAAFTLILEAFFVNSLFAHSSVYE